MPLIEDIDIPALLTIFSLTLSANFVLFRRLLYSLVDPIWFLVILNTTVTMALVIYDRYIQNDLFSKTVIYLILSQLLFIASARFTKWAVTRNVRPQVSFSHETYEKAINSRNVVRLLNVSTFILTFIAIYYVITGLPAFSGDPELARVMSRREGGGAITRLLNVFSYFSLTLWFYCRLKRLRISRISSSLGFILPFLLLLFVGAKSSLLLVYISFFYVSYYVSSEAGRPFLISAKYFFMTAIAILFVSVLLLYARAEEVSTTTDSLEFAGLQLVGRIVFSGIGAFHFFSTTIPELYDLNLLDYLYQYIVLPFFAPLRLLSYQPTVGSILAVSISGDDTFGPNPSMYVEGQIYFGWIGGVLYCGVLGVIFSFFRYYPMNLRRLPSFVRVIVFSFGNMVIMSMTYDMILFAGDVINSFFFVTPILFGAMLVNELGGLRGERRLSNRQ